MPSSSLVPVGEQDSLVQYKDMRASVLRLPLEKRKRILITGGAGFIGSHLVDRLMIMGHEVIVLDNFYTGGKHNISHWTGHPHFEHVRHDVVNPFMAEVDQIYHLACPASPPHYQSNQVKTIKTNFQGTYNMLGLAKRTGARMLLASTSEVYGDPEISPQPETYRGNVSCNGPRACYDEGKRVAESLVCELFHFIRRGCRTDSPSTLQMATSSKTMSTSELPASSTHMVLECEFSS